MEEVRRDMFEYIELFYNRKRMHSYIQKAPHSSLGFTNTTEGMVPRHDHAGERQLPSLREDGYHQTGKVEHINDRMDIVFYEKG